MRVVPDSTDTAVRGGKEWEKLVTSCACREQRWTAPRGATVKGDRELGPATEG
jgi:hypothetical protein